MDKKTYYVVPQTREVMEHKDDHAFELEIQATPEELLDVHDLLERINHEDFETFLDGHYWAINETHVDNKQYDDALHELYRKLYELGTPHTQEQIKKLGLM